jgi:hypothetical protein
MASGNSLVVFKPQDNEPVGSSGFATLSTRNGHVVLEFDAASDESAWFSAVLPRHYAGGGVTVRLGWMAASATSGSCRWEVAFERHDDEGTDLDADSFASAQSAGGTAPSTSGAMQYTDIAFTDGAQMDSLAVGESFRLLVRRDANGTTGTDDMTGDAQLVSVEIRET